MCILLHDTIYVFLQDLLNVLVQIANKMGYDKMIVIVTKFY
jgi:hypothetical protein